MQREIIQIDENKCNGCGLCITACHEGALALVEGKARLVKDSWCDGLGACLPDCPTGAISIVRREADAFDEQAVAAKSIAPSASSDSGCPGTQIRSLNQKKRPGPASVTALRRLLGGSGQPARNAAEPVSELRQWPVQLKLVPAGAPFLHGASLLIAADCAAYARAGFHRDFIRGRITLIGCPKLDNGDYTEKLTQVFRLNTIKSIMVVRMEVPCCGGLEQAVRKALQASGKTIPWQVVVLSANGTIVDT
jgi:ferredoxin